MNKNHVLDDEKPLDPAVEKIRQRMVRLMVISIGIMMIGLMSVLGAIVYKIGKTDNTPDPKQKISLVPSKTIANSIPLPKGASLISADLDGSHILLRIKLEDGKQQLVIYDIPTTRILATYNLDN